MNDMFGGMLSVLKFQDSRAMASKMFDMFSEPAKEARKNSIRAEIRKRANMIHADDKSKSWKDCFAEASESVMAEEALFNEED